MGGKCYKLETAVFFQVQRSFQSENASNASRPLCRSRGTKLWKEIVFEKLKFARKARDFHDIIMLSFRPINAKPAYSFSISSI